MKAEFFITKLTMDVWNTKPGDKVVYDHPDNGYAGSQEVARRHLTLGSEYTIQSIEMFQSSTSVVFEEFPGVMFNSVLFSNVKGGSKNV